MSFAESAHAGVCRATQEDDMGQLYLTNVDFLKNGVPASIIAMLVSYSCREHLISPQCCEFQGRFDNWLLAYENNVGAICVSAGVP